MAKVAVRRDGPATSVGTDGSRDYRAPSGVVVEAGRVRIALASRFDRAVLAAVLDVVVGGERR